MSGLGWPNPLPDSHHAFGRPEVDVWGGPLPRPLRPERASFVGPSGSDPFGHGARWVTQTDPVKGPRTRARGAWPKPAKPALGTYANNGSTAGHGRAKVKGMNEPLRGADQQIHPLGSTGQLWLRRCSCMAKKPRSKAASRNRVPAPRQTWEARGRRDADLISLTKLRRDWDLRRQLEREAAALVAALRAQGHSWTAIGAACGISRQAATKRWGSPCAS